MATQEIRKTLTLRNYKENQVKILDITKIVEINNTDEINRMDKAKKLS